MAILNPYNYKKPRMAVNLPKKANLKPVKPISRPKKQADSYLEQRVMTAKPQELTLMLYEGLVKFIKLSIHNIEQDNIEKSSEMSLRAQAIVNELRATLNTDYELSKEFDALYDFISTKLVAGNIKKDVDAYQQALEIAIELHDTWKQIIENN